MIFLAPFSTTLDLETLRKETGIVSLHKPVFLETLVETVVFSLYPSDDFLPFSLHPHAKTGARIPERIKDLHILVAEDNKINQIVIRELLASHGYRCDIVDNGREAVEAVKKRNYDLVLMDCQMPEVDGYEATRMIRERENIVPEFSMRKHLPIIALTAHASQSDEEKCLRAGMDYYCTKPVDQKRLFELIRDCFEKNLSTVSGYSKNAGDVD